MKSKKRSRSSGHGGGGAGGGGGGGRFGSMASAASSLSSTAAGSAWTGHDHEHRNQRQAERQLKKKLKKEPESKGSGASAASSAHTATTRPWNDNDDSDERPPELSFAEKRRAALTHGTKDKLSEIQLRLHWVRTQKKVDALRARLVAWDPDDESSIVVGLETDPPANDESLPTDAPKRKKGRKGPETWKLRGAARPAHEVYDFDVRYVDPHQTALDSAQAKARRIVNVLAFYKGRVSSILLSDSNDKLSTPRLLSLVRQYLTLLMQFGHLSVELKRYKTAREAWLECVDLEGDPPDEGSTNTSHGNDRDGGGDAPCCSVTTAREELVRMDLQQMSTSTKRVQAAWKFLSERVGRDRSSWISYTRALVACILQRDDAEAHVVEAIRTNLYCGYNLAFWEPFRSAVEYTDDVCNSDDAPQTDLELALEYCTDKLLTKAWQSSGAAMTLRQVLLNALRGRHNVLKPADVDINHRLEALQQKLSSREVTHGQGQDDDIVTGTSTPPNPSLDLEMYVGMFRTAVEMVQEAGLLR